MVYANFSPTYTNVTTKPVTQWDYGRTLRIDGLKLPTAVRIDFCISGEQETTSRIGITKDGVTDVVIPDSFLEQSNDLVAYVYVNDTTTGKTVKTINIPVDARPKPEEYDSPESKELFAEAIELINDVAVRAEDAEASAKTHADSAKESLESTQRIATAFDETATKAVNDVNDAGASQVQAVNTAKTNTLKAVQAEGAAQVKAIQDEGASQLEQIQVAGENIVEASAIAEQNAKNVLANAIKGHLKGEVVTADDVSPLEHEMVVKVKNKNMIGAFKETKSFVRDGVTLSVEKDGQTIRLNGTCGVVAGGRNVFNEIASPILLEKGKTYTLSSEMVSGVTDGTYAIYINSFGEYEAIASVTNADDGRTKTFVPNKTVECFVGVNIAVNTTYEDVVIRFQLEEGNTATEYTPYIDPATVNVRRCGKNLINDSYGSVNSHSLLEESEHSYTIKGNVGTKELHYDTGQLMIPYAKTEDILTYGVKLKAGVTYAISFIYSLKEQGVYNNKIKMIIYDENLIVTEMKDVSCNVGGTTEFYCNYTPSKDESIGLTFRLNNNLVSISNVQIEINATATSFEPYKGTDHTPSSDGTVSGMMSTAPNMTILTDTEGIVVECEYIKDSNKVIEKLVNAIIGLGGTV